MSEFEDKNKSTVMVVIVRTEKEYEESLLEKAIKRIYTSNKNYINPDARYFENNDEMYKYINEVCFTNFIVYVYEYDTEYNRIKSFILSNIGQKQINHTKKKTEFKFYNKNNYE